MLLLCKLLLIVTTVISTFAGNGWKWEKSHSLMSAVILLVTKIGS